MQERKQEVTKVVSLINHGEISTNCTVIVVNVLGRRLYRVKERRGSYQLLIRSVPLN